MWGRPVEAKRTDSAATPTAQADATTYLTSAPEAPAPRAAAPAGAAPVTPVPATTPAQPVAPAPSAVGLPAAPGPVVQPVAPRARARSSAAAPSTAAPVEQVSRRSRRSQTDAQPVAVVPPIAPVGPAEPERPAAAFEAELTTREEPAPLLDAVLAPAEPFELLEPAATAVPPASTTPVPAPASTTAVPAPVSSATPAEGASTWMADSFAKLLAAEAAEPVATTVPAVEAAPPQPTAAPLESPAPAQKQAEPQTTSAPRAAAPSQTATTATTAQAAAGAGASASTEPRASHPRTERPRTERIEPLTGPIPEPAASGIDEFEAASRLFAFTGETPVQPPAPEAEAEAAPHAAPRRPQTRRGSAFKRVATASFSVGVFGIVGLMAVGMTTPAEAVAAVNGTDASLSVLAAGDDSVPVIDEAEIQAYVAPGDAQSDTLQRTENYSTTTTAQLASEAGIRNFSNLFHNNPNSNIQWPFAVGVTMSYGFGMRSGRMHEGIDFTPGNGAPVQAIADGTVRVASEAGGAYGVHVIIDHIVDGQMVSSHYAHMQYGSLQVSAGQHVTVGTVIGRTGNTGRSYGAHTHFEILKNGTTAIDPWPWLQQYTDGTHTVG
ncbi:M23 family metallopeptidase [Microbacterium trichothecenolyticum]|uniref:M23 family metallopeptidase n=1 Tax=Microbacterium trichothecenolyticum TaxID=69370 RepID=UPI0027E35FCB|nr:peptidoglycan DD-metalloendopeptidase family protein [Microbacterium trichothecenolyticum]